jgi:hypothetical protein
MSPSSSRTSTAPAVMASDRAASATTNSEQRRQLRVNRVIVRQGTWPSTSACPRKQTLLRQRASDRLLASACPCPN